MEPESFPEKKGLQQYSTRNDCKLSHLKTNIIETFEVKNNPINTWEKKEP